MTEKLTSHLEVVKEELRLTEQKRLAQFPVRVRKVKRLRRQITELNRALRREKSTAAYWQDWYIRAREAIVVATTDSDNMVRGWETLYDSANSRAESWKRLTYSMGWIGFAVGGAVAALAALAVQMSGVWK